MVKQFTIPCQFQGGATSPVTLYIGHPEAGHHPVHFQSDWLSSAKGGTIPQDLMDTLQKLHDLANENGADFEELCYYALISATQHGVDNGVSTEDINKYADEYIKQEGNVNVTEQQANTTSNSSGQDLKDNTIKTDTTNEQKNEDVNIKEADAIISDLQSKATSEQMKETLDALGNITKEYVEPIINAQQSEHLQNKADDTTSSDIITAYSDEDEDLLLMDDLSPN